jgi:GrpB-like predicted nucleotidyltransferase (UPF0157 family)
MLIQEYQESWKDNFLKIQKILLEVLNSLNIRIEHVGSTSVPKLAAKPIIDIDIVFEKNVDFEDIKYALEKIGYYHNGNQGIKDREVFKRTASNNPYEVLDEIAHHLYVCPIDSTELQRHILFRNHLLENEEARLFYQQLKYEIAREVNQDKKKYAELKEIRAKKFIDEAIEKSKK